MLLSNRIKERLREYYRFVIMDDATFEEKIVFKLKPLSIFVTVVISILALIFLSISLVAFTSLREYIPGYGSTKQGEKITSLQIKVDSLNLALFEMENYGNDIKRILLGEDFLEDTSGMNDFEKKEVNFTMTNYDSLLLQLIDEEPIFIKEQSEQQFIKSQQNSMHTLFFPPVSGMLQQRYSEQHQYISIAAKKNASVYASTSGTVIYEGYDLQNGTSLIINYPNNGLMIYRQVGTPQVSVGDVVKAKQVIAITDFDQVVYFELWIDGTAVNPENYILFK